jgi:hypothetical protein
MIFVHKGEKLIARYSGNGKWTLEQVKALHESMGDTVTEVKDDE